MINIDAQDYLSGFYEADVYDNVGDESDLTEEDEADVSEAISVFWTSRDSSIYNALIRVQDKFDCDLSLETSACPLQIEGGIDGYTVCFRSRYDHWRLVIGETKTGSVYEAEGVAETDGSWMEASELEKILMRCFGEYRKVKDE